VITQLLRMSGTTSDVERFPSHISDILGLVSREGATVRFSSGGEYSVHATPAADGAPEVWLLGSSDYSAQLAAAVGLPYVFANHFSGQGLERALDLYRTTYQPSEAQPEPRTFLTANVLVAQTADEADARALPNLRMTARLRTNMPLVALETVEQAIAGAADFDGLGDSFMASARANWFVGEPGAVASDLRAFAAKHGVDEIMISPIAGSYDGEPMDASPGRDQTLELHAAELALT